MPMCLLTPSDVETAICSIPDGDKIILNSTVRRHFFYFGGVPRWAMEYILSLLELLPPNGFLTVEAIEESFKRMKNSYV